MITHALQTRAGRVHPENQDRMATDPAQGTFIVADGMGGLADAAAAAQAVVDQFPEQICERIPALAAPDITRAVTVGAAELNERMRRTARRGPDTTGAATALLLVRDGMALAVHLGDSRIYLARDGQLHRLTDDHAYAGQLTRFVGMPGTVAPGVSVHELRVGDRFLLCTDGLTGNVEEAALGGMLNAADMVAGACRQLVEAAVTGGAIDDISVIVVEYGRSSNGAARQR